VSRDPGTSPAPWGVSFLCRWRPVGSSGFVQSSPGFSCWRCVGGPFIGRGADRRVHGAPSWRMSREAAAAPRPRSGQAASGGGAAVVRRWSSNRCRDEAGDGQASVSSVRPDQGVDLVSCRTSLGSSTDTESLVPAPVGRALWRCPENGASALRNPPYSSQTVNVHPDPSVTSWVRLLGRDCPTT
jgi:hypothetical protein